MTKAQFYGGGFPYRTMTDMPGKLIVLEGTDSVGRSTQIGLLRKWLEDEGFAVADTGLNRSPLTQVGLDQAKEGHTLGRQTRSDEHTSELQSRINI